MCFFLLGNTLLISCKKEESPERVLRSYIDLSFSSSASRSDFVARTTGELREQILEMTDEEFDIFADMGHFDMRRFRIEREACADDICHITYIISYRQFDGPKDSDDRENVFDAEVRKIAELTLEDERWKISDVKDVKTFFDSKKAIEP